MKRQFTILLVTAVILLTLVGTLASSGCAKKPVVAALKIGSSIAQTGPAARFTVPLHSGALLAVSEINAGGGIVYGGVAHPVSYINYDDQYEPSRAAKFARKLLYEDKVDVIITSVISTGSLAMFEVIGEQKILTFSQGWSTKLIGSDKPYAFRISNTPHEYAGGLYKWARKTYPNAKTVAFVGPDYLTAHEYLDNELRHEAGAARTNDFELIYESLYPQGTTDFYPIVTGLMARKPDIIHWDVMPASEIFLLVKALHELGNTAPTISTVTTDVGEILKYTSPEAAEGVITAVMDWSSDLVPPEGRAFYNNYVEKFGENVGGADQTYQMLYIAKQAIEACDSLDAEKLTKWLETNEVKILYGMTKFGGESFYGISHQLVWPVPLKQIVNGKPALVFLESPKL